MDYEARKANEAAFPAVVRAILPHLGAVWAVIDQHECYCLAESGLTRARLCFWLDGYAGRIEITPRTPDCLGERTNARDFIPYKEKLPKASVSMTREPARLAAEIQRRVIDPWMVYLPKINETLREREATTGRVSAAALRIARILGDEHVIAKHNQHRAMEDYNISGYQRAEGDPRFRLTSYGSVHVEITGLGLRGAERLARVLVDMKAERENANAGLLPGLQEA